MLELGLMEILGPLQVLTIYEVCYYLSPLLHLRRGQDAQWQTGRQNQAVWFQGLVTSVCHIGWTGGWASGIIECDDLWAFSLQHQALHWHRANLSKYLING